jgi:hypothetical protein
VEHRGDPRREVNIEIAIDCRWGTVGGRALNLSRGGIFVELWPSPLEINSRAEVMLVLPNQETGALRLSALVVHATPNGAGLMFLHGDHEIARLCATKTDPGAIQP